MVDGLPTQPDTRKAALTDLAERGAHFVLCHSEKSAAAANAKLKAAGKEEKATFKGPLGRWQKRPATLDAVLRHEGPVGVIAASLGCVVVDMDSGGDAARKEIISLLHRPLAQVPTHRDGGSHLWYKSRDAAKIGNGKFLYGDIRGNDKGFIILWDAGLVAAGLASSESLVNLNEADLARLPPLLSVVEGGRNDALNKEVFKATLKGEPIEPHVNAAREAGLGEPEIAATVASSTAGGERVRGTEVPNPRSPDGFAYCLNGLGIGLRLNTRAKRYEYRIDGAWEHARDEREAWLRGLIAKTYKAKSGANLGRLKYSADMFLELKRALGNDSRVDPFREWLEALAAWDGTARIDNLLCHMFGAENTRLVRWASGYIGIGAIQRAYEPGGKLDEVPVLLGDQGTGKSAFVRAWFSEAQHEWHGDGVDLGARPKEQSEQLSGRAVCELSELAGLRKAEIEKLKSFITRQDDGQFRWAYARSPVPSPRVCVFVGTTNEPECLPNDPSGNRRFVVIELAHGCDVQAASVDREQWWAEALARYHKGDRANLPRELHQVAADNAEGHRSRDSLEEDVHNAVCDLDQVNGFTLMEIYAIIHTLHMPAAPDKAYQMRLGAALRNEGFKSFDVQRGGVRQYLWRKV